jgi:hypothetical protein
MTCPTAATPSLKDRGIDVEDLVGQKVSAHIIVKEYEGKKRNYIGWYLDTPDCPLPKELAYLLLSEFAKWNKDNPCPADDGRYRWIFRAACAGRRCSLPPEWTANLIRRLLTRTERDSNEIRHQVANAYKTDLQDYDHEEKPKVKPYDPAQLAEWEKRLPFTLTSQWLKDHSRIDVSTVTPGSNLNYIHPGRKVVVVNAYKSKGGYIYQDHPAEDKEMTAFANGNRPDQAGKAGGWFCSNAVNGEWIDDSIRSGANLVTYDMGVMESDKKPTPEVPNVARAWCAMLIQQPDIAIVSLVHTGNESVHALVKIPARNKKEFNAEKRRLIEKYTPLGLDPAAVRPVQLTRLPGIRRSDNGRVQELYYLNPKPIAGAIYKQNSLGVTRG